MTDYIETHVGDDGKLLIEVGSSTQGVGFGRAKADVSKEIQETREQAFQGALETIRLTADSVLNTLRSLSERPDTARVDFGIKFEAEVGAMIARNTNEAQIRISFSWNTEKDKAED